MSTMIPFRQIDGSVRDVDLVLENDVEGFMLFRPRTDRGVKALQAVLQHVGGPREPVRDSCRARYRG